MEKIIDSLENYEGFNKYLKLLTHGAWKKSEESFLHDIALQLNGLLEKSWFSDRLPDDLDNNVPPEIVGILFIAYCFKLCFENTSDEKLLLNLLLVFAKHIRPAYRGLIEDDLHALDRSIHHEDTKRWVTEGEDRKNALNALGLPDISQELISYALIEFRKHDTSTVARWTTIGLHTLHQEILTVLDLKKTVEFPSNKKEKKSLPPQSLLAVETSSVQENKWQPPQEQVDRYLLVSNSPIMRSYLTPDIWHDVIVLWEQLGDFPNIEQIADGLIEKSLSTTNFNSDEKIQAHRLLSLLPSWAANLRSGGRSVERQIIVNQMHSFNQDTLSKILNTLLECGLLSNSGTEIAFKHNFLFDFFLARSMTDIRSATWPLPPQNCSIPLSNWLFLMMWFFYQDGSLSLCDGLLCKIQGTLPGIASGSWMQIPSILDLLPDSVLTQHCAWLFASIACEIGQRTLDIDSLRKGELNRLRQRLPQHPDDLLSETERVLDQYLASIRALETMSDNSRQNLVDLITKPALFLSGEHWLLKKQIISLLRHIRPQEKFLFRSILKHGKELELNEIITYTISHTQDENEVLALAEPLVFWGLVEKLDFLSRIEVSSDTSIKVRAAIFKHAIEKSSGYLDWV